MTKLSINVNKIALLRNSRGRDYPNVVTFARKFIALGVHGITVHPREDQRHIKDQDAVDLGELLRGSEVEFNVEGYPSAHFLELVEKCSPTQATLVPDAPGQLTSDHGWDLTQHLSQVQRACERLHKANVRSAIFLDASVEAVKLAKESGTERIELYTESFAHAFAHGPDPVPEKAQERTGDDVLEDYRAAASAAVECGIGVNAGHDLDKRNLAKFLSIGNILEVSIGHALTIECIEEGMASVVREYLDICASA